MKLSIIITAYLEAYRLFSMTLTSDINNYEAILESRNKLIVISKSFIDKPIQKSIGVKLYVSLSSIDRSNKLVLINRDITKMSESFDTELAKLSDDDEYKKLYDANNKLIDIDDIAHKDEVRQMAISFVNLIRLTKLEHGTNGIKYLVSSYGINLPQWWIHTKMNNFSIKSLKHSLKLIEVSTTKGASVASSRYLANGSGALFPVNLTAAYLIDAFKVVGKRDEAKNKLVIDYLNAYQLAIENGYTFVDSPAKAKIYAKSYNHGINFLDLRMHLTVTALSGFGNFLNKGNFEFFRYHFWRFNHISLKRKLLT